jgi:DNA-binding MarR family transcriptional regulator
MSVTSDQLTTCCQTWDGLGVPLPGPHPLEHLVDEVLRTAGRLLVATSTSVGGGLSGPQMLVLSAVVRADAPPTVPQIGRSLGHSRQAVQRLADGLRERGLIERLDNPEHKRARRLVATARGRDVHTEADLDSRVWAARMTRDLSPGQIEAAATTLRTLRQHLEAARAAASR